MSSSKAQPPSAAPVAPTTYVQTLAAPGNKEGGTEAVEVDVSI